MQLSRTGAALTVDIEIVESDDQLLAGWGDLADRLGSPIFQHPAWVSEQHDAYGDGPLLAAVARSNGALDGIVPLESLGSRRLRTVSYNPTPRTTFVARDTGTLAGLLSAAACESGGRVDVPRVDGGSRFMVEALREVGNDVAVRTTVTHHNPFLLLPATVADLDATYSRNRRKQMRRRRRRLEEMGSVEVRLDPDCGTGIIDEALALDCGGWKGREGTAISQRSDARQFYERMAAWARSTGALRVATLRLDGRLVAYDLILVEDRTCWVVTGSYDEALRHLGPGIALIDEEIRWAIGAGLQRFELCGAEADYKSIWADRLCPVITAQLWPATIGGRAARAAAAADRRIRRTIERVRHRREIGSPAPKN